MSCYTGKNSLRYERKFFITHLTLHEVESTVMLHPAAFSEIYYTRRVNNIYLDSFDLGNYFDNVIGLERRAKVRIRWYGGLYGAIDKPILEIKVKQGSVSVKTCFTLPGFEFGANFSGEGLRDVFKRSDIPDRMKLELACMDISLLNTYQRRYFLSADRRYRVTVDSGLEFYGIAGFANNFLDRSIDHIAVVMEVKYDGEDSAGADKITSWFPFRMTKSSKYIMGIERLNLMKTYSHV